ncbi:hypothetical protein ACFL20_13650, partial [Spirochaetota bacterium]
FKKTSRYVTVKIKKINRVKFKNGIYIVKLDKKYNVIMAKRVSSVYLNPRRFQNQLYLKNSYFAVDERLKSL